MKKYSTVLFLCMISHALFSAGKWTDKGIFPPDSTQKNYGVHGLAVDPEGKVWIVNYYATGRDTLRIPTDSVTTAQGRYKSIVALQVYKADGSKAPFHPIMNLTMMDGSRGDTLGGATLAINNKWSGNSGRGARKMYDGNILVAYWNNLYQIDYKTGRGIRSLAIPSFVNGLAGPDCDENGNIYATNVFGGFPIKMYDNYFNAGFPVTDTTNGFNRTLISSKDGKDIFETGYTTHHAKRFHSEMPGLIPYTLADTVFKGMDIEAGVWDPKGRIWVASGSYYDLPNRYPGKTTYWDTCMYYCFTPPNYVTPTDSIKQVFFQATKANERPRAIAFSPTGDTAYIGSFSSGVVRRFIFEGGVTPPVLPPVTPTSEWVSFWSDSSYFDGRKLAAGDIIEALDPQGVRCGAFAVTTAGSYGLMPVYRDDATTTVDEGAQPGDALSFKVNGYPARTYGPALPVWTANGDVKKVNIAATKAQTVALRLQNNWNLVSWNVDTPVDAASTVFAPVANKMTVALSFDGGGLTYDPAIPIEFNTLKTADHIHGYWMKMKDTSTLNVAGPLVDRQTPIALKSGYNLVSYLPEKADSTRNALSSVLGNTAVVMGFDAAGLTFDPSIPADFNTLKVMRPGFGYWIKMKSAGTLIYPAAGVMPIAPSAGREFVQNAAISGDITPTHEWISVWGNNMSLFGKMIPAGTVITASTKTGVVCGAATAWADGKFGLMSIYKDDPSTKEIEGAKAGEQITLTIGAYTVPKTIVWTENGAVINLAEAMTGVAELSSLPTEFALEQNYPNPFNPSTTIRYALPKAGFVTIKIYDAIGRETATLVSEQKEAGYYSAQWNAAGMTSGVYFYTIRSGEFSKTMKLQLVK